jgi:MFS transporter, FHS family, L-fucose permease
MRGRTVQSSVTNFTAAFVLTVSLFALWGMGHRLYDTLLSQFTTAFELRGFELALTQNLNSVVYFLGAIPAALYARRFGYKAGIGIGLGSLCIGAFLLYPAAETQTYAYFLFAVALMSCGWITLEVAANPLVASLGAVETSVLRLNLAQSFFPLGAMLGSYAGHWMITVNLALPAAHNAYAIVHPYIMIAAGVLLLRFLVEEVRFPPVATEHSDSLRGAAGDFRKLLSHPLFIFAIVAQVFSVMAMAGTWSICGRYFSSVFPGMSQIAGLNIFTLSFAIFAAGRFAGTVLMVKFAPDRLLEVFSGCGILLSLIAVCWGGPVGVGAMLASNLFLSITWPTVLGLAIRGSGSLAKIGTALVCMGGAVGGVAYSLMTAAWTFSSVQLAMLVPAFSYAVLLAFAVFSERQQRAETADTGIDI